MSDTVKATIIGSLIIGIAIIIATNLICNTIERVGVKAKRFITQHEKKFVRFYRVEKNDLRGIMRRQLGDARRIVKQEKAKVREFAERKVIPTMDK